MITRRAALALAAAGTLPMAGAEAADAAPSTPDAAFAALSRRALDHWIAVSPITATFQGDHHLDAELDDLSPAGRARALAGSQRLLAELEALDVARLSRENQVDAAILRNQLRYDAWGWQVSQDWAWDPQVYSQAAGNALYAAGTRKIQTDVSTGTSLTNAMMNTRLFPNMVLQMTQIGEESGSLDGMLGKVADFYEREVDDAVGALSSLLEPIIIVFLGVVIGGLVVAMYLPIFKLGAVI